MTTPPARVVTVSGPLDCLGRLTDRQREVLRAVCEHGVEGAALRLCLSPCTVKNHLSDIYDRVGFESGAQRVPKIGRACYLLGRDDGRRRAG